MMHLTAMTLAVLMVVNVATAQTGVSTGVGFDIGIRVPILG